MGGVSASFYGWLPLYLPELFPTRVRATGQGLSFNFGRILAAIGVLLGTGQLAGFFGGYGKGRSRDESGVSCGSCSDLVCSGNPR